MSIPRAILCVLCPPLAVIDRGCGAFIITFFLSFVGWIPGILAALLFNLKQQ